MSIGYFVSVVDSCVNPSVTLTSTSEIYFADTHPSLKNLSVYISVVSGSIQLQSAPSDSEYLVIQVIRGASSEESVNSLTSFFYNYNDTHLSLIGETSSTLLDCPTVKIIVTVPSTFAPNRWTLVAQTGQVYIENFYGSQTDMEIRVTTGAVHIDHLVVQSLDVFTNAGAVFWKDSLDSEVSKAATIQTNSGYIGISEVSVTGSLSAGTNTGVLTLEKVNSASQLSASGLWGVVHLSDCHSPVTYVYSDSAHICFMNSWDLYNSVVEFITETGSINTDNLEYTYEKECKTDNRCQFWFASDETSAVHYSYIRTVSGTVTLGNL